MIRGISPFVLLFVLTLRFLNLKYLLNYPSCFQATSVSSEKKVFTYTKKISSSIIYIALDYSNSWLEFTLKAGFKSIFSTG